MALLHAEHLRKSYGELVAVDGLSLDVQPREIFGLLGPNGAGKSTTMLMIAGLLSPDTGTIRLEGQRFTPDRRDLRAMLGVVPQELAVYPELTGRENLTFFGRLYGLRGGELRQRIEAVLAEVGLRERADSRVGTYSGGMKRRLNFGVGLLHRPRLLILDEPTVGVDPQSRAHLLDLIVRLKTENIGVIYASHYMDEVQAICDRVAIMDEGRILAADRLDQLLARTRSQVVLEVTPDSRPLRERLKELEDVEVTGDADAVRIVLTESRTGRLASKRPLAVHGGSAAAHGSIPGGDSIGDSGDGRHDRPGRVHHQLMHTLQWLDELGLRLCSIETRAASLEQVFLQLTGKRLRD